MQENTVFDRVKRSENNKRSSIIRFLRANDLNIDTTVDIFVTASRNGNLIACGGIAGNIIKCVAIDESVRGEGLTLTLATELINLAYERQCVQLFIYTKSKNENLFKQCGFYPIARVPNIMVLMENSSTHLQQYASYLTTLRHSGNKIGCIVMNANPFTLGHRYLIQQAAAQCDWLHVFMVKEDTSRFKYEDRLHLVRAGTKNIEKITVHRGSEYMISRATFPCYFIKEQGVINHCYTEIDLQIFRNYLAPALGITHRFVGTEPSCELTASYNHDMRMCLGDCSSTKAPPIDVVEIERLQYQGRAISASWVRKLLVKKDLATIACLVPPVTRDYLQCMVEHQKSKLVIGEK